MFKQLYKIIFVVITTSFFVSATEMNLGECHNTFFDEYDTYVRAEKVSLPQSAVSFEDQNTYILASLFLAYYSLKEPQTASFKHEYSTYLNYNPPKLFLRNSVWRV